MLRSIALATAVAVVRAQSDGIPATCDVYVEDCTFYCNAENSYCSNNIFSGDYKCYCEEEFPCFCSETMSCHVEPYCPTPAPTPRPTPAPTPAPSTAAPTWAPNKHMCEDYVEDCTVYCDAENSWCSNNVFSDADWMCHCDEEFPCFCSSLMACTAADFCPTPEPTPEPTRDPTKYPTSDGPAPTPAPNAHGCEDYVESCTLYCNAENADCGWDWECHCEEEFPCFCPETMSCVAGPFCPTPAPTPTPTPQPTPSPSTLTPTGAPNHHMCDLYVEDCTFYCDAENAYCSNNIISGDYKCYCEEETPCFCEEQMACFAGPHCPTPAPTTPAPSIAPVFLNNQCLVDTEECFMSCDGAYRSCDVLEQKCECDEDHPCFCGDGNCHAASSCPSFTLPTFAPAVASRNCQADARTCSLLSGCDGEHSTCDYLAGVCVGEDGFDCYCGDGDYYDLSACPYDTPWPTPVPETCAEAPGETCMLYCGSATEEDHYSCEDSRCVCDAGYPCFCGEDFGCFAETCGRTSPPTSSVDYSAHSSETAVTMGHTNVGGMILAAIGCLSLCCCCGTCSQMCFRTVRKSMTKKKQKKAHLGFWLSFNLATLLCVTCAAMYPSEPEVWFGASEIWLEDVSVWDAQMTVAGYLDVTLIDHNFLWSVYFSDGLEFSVETVDGYELGIVVVDPFKIDPGDEKKIRVEVIAKHESSWDGASSLWDLGMSCFDDAGEIDIVRVVMVARGADDEPELGGADGFAGGRGSTFGAESPMAKARARGAQDYNVGEDAGFDARGSVVGGSNPMGANRARDSESYNVSKAAGYGKSESTVAGANPMAGVKMRAEAQLQGGAGVSGAAGYGERDSSFAGNNPMAGYEMSEARGFQRSDSALEGVNPMSATHSKQKHAFKMSQSKDYPRKSRGGGDDDDFGGFDDMFPKPNTDF
ncbi:hypothetical protein SO694_00059149 [Aureococcus anophagefferens]|uniref:EGF-like domain-containing protein n=1 Tax=Aureococcus anophagefferens TaxID=44056 RepID=A0ABR1FYQ0_AURAN|nr:hypothetical protein JL721_4751 [Aureococcus anophagefferens]